MSRPARAPLAALPPWLAHALRAQRGPVPWNAVVRGALSAGPLLLAAVLAGHATGGVVAALGAMLAGVNDRPGSRRAAISRIGVPGLAGAAGFLAGTYAGDHAGAVPLTLWLTLLGLVGGSMSAIGPVASGAGTQLLVAAAVGAGMPLPETGVERTAAFLAGAGWLLILRLVLPTPGTAATAPPAAGSPRPRFAIAAHPAVEHAAGPPAASRSGTGKGRRFGRRSGRWFGPGIGRRFGLVAGRRFGLRPGFGLGGGSRLEFRFDGERVALAAVYDAVAALLDATGTDRAPARRAALTAALDHAQDALDGPRLRRRAGSAAERRLHAQYAAALPLAEAATALAWEGEQLPGRTSEGPRRLAATVRAGGHTGPLPAPSRSAPALRALDDALLHAAESFDRGDRDRARAPGLHERSRTAASLLHAALGSAGREYGVRVALSFGASAAVAQALHHAHWYWLPATAVFLVKPDLGPLVSRVLCRAAGTVLGAVVFAGFAAVLPRPGGLVALVAVSGALIPVATRHFAAQTAVVTVLVLSLIMVGGEPPASWSRIGETLLACAIVLLVGHLTMPGQRGGGVRARLTEAVGAAHAYLAHVLITFGAGVETGVGAGAGGGAGTVDGERDASESESESGTGGGEGAEPGDRARRWTLRREAYRTLAGARAAIDRSAAELPVLARHTEGTDEVAATLERLVDTTTACAVHLDDTGHLTPAYARRLAELLDQLDERSARAGLPVPAATGAQDGAVPKEVAVAARTRRTCTSLAP